MSPLRTLPEERAPAHPGEVLLEECIRPAGMTITEAAERMKVSRVRLSELVNGSRGMTPDTALRVGRLFGTDPEVWLNLQVRFDLWHVMRSERAEEIEEIEPAGQEPGVRSDS